MIIGKDDGSPITICDYVVRVHDYLKAHRRDIIDAFKLYHDWVPEEDDGIPEPEPGRFVFDGLVERDRGPELLELSVKIDDRASVAPGALILDNNSRPFP